MEITTVLLLLILITLISILIFVRFCHLRLKEINETLTTIFNWEHKDDNWDEILDGNHPFGRDGDKRLKLLYESVLRRVKLQENQNKFESESFDKYLEREETRKKAQE